MMPIASPGKAIGVIAPADADAEGTDEGPGLPDAVGLGEADDAGPVDVDVDGAGDGDAHNVANW